jgi:integrase
MASIYPKQRSPYWYIQFRDPRTGRLVDRSTKLRRDDREQTRKAKQLEVQYTADELKHGGLAANGSWDWVTDYLAGKYSDSPLTLARYKQAWFALKGYFDAKGIRTPRLLTYEQCLSYIPWRQDPPTESGVRKAAHNTALLDLKVLSLLMRSAVQRGLADSNPALQLGIKRIASKEKDEITEEEVAVIERELANEPDYLRYSWQIAMRHGCRLREICIDFRRVHLETKPPSVSFFVKGRKEHSVMLHPELTELFRSMKTEGKRTPYDMPENFSKKWKAFFKKCGFANLSFHCTRVTCVTRLARAGVDLRIAMDYIGHSSTLVHRIYQRLKPADHGAAIRALASSASAPSHTP